MLARERSSLSNLKDNSAWTEDQSLILSRRVQDVEGISQVFQGCGFSMTQLSAEPCEGELFIVQTAGLQLIRIVVNCAVYTSGGSKSNGLTFTTTLTPLATELIVHKTALPQQSLFGFDPTREASLITPRQLDLVIVMVSAAKLQEYLHEVERDDLDDQFFKRNYIQPVDETLSNLQAYLRQIFYLVTAKPDFLRRSQTLIKGDLLPLLVNCLSTETAHKLRVQPFRRSVIVQQAEEFIMAHLDQPLTLQDLCKAVKVSKSALSYGFQDIFGISPMAYLKIQRLNGARRALKVSNPETDTVLGVANHYGFWHMGHFSTDYKQMFGESPSKTLSRFG